MNKDKTLPKKRARKEDKTLLSGYARTAWKSEVYPTSISKDGKPSLLVDVVRGVRLMFKARRIAWNRCIEKCRETDRESYVKFKETGVKSKDRLCYAGSELYRVGVGENPRFPNTFSAYVLDFFHSKPRPTARSPIPGLFWTCLVNKNHPLFARYLQSLQGPWSIPEAFKRGQPNRKCTTDVSHSCIAQAYKKWQDESNERKADKSKMAKAVRWAKHKKGRYPWQYGRPRYHRRNDSCSTYLHNQAFDILDNHLFIGGIPGSFKIAHPMPWTDLSQEEKIVIAGANLTEKAGRFFLAISVQVPAKWLQIKRSDDQVVGIDLGISNAAVSADAVSGTVTCHHLPRYWEDRRMRLLQKRRRKWSHALQRRLDRAKKMNMSPWKSKGYQEAVRKLQEINLEISNIRRDAQNKLTTSLVKRSACLIVEDLNVRGMVTGSEEHASGAKECRKRILDTGFGEIRRQITYKTPRSGGRLLVASQWYASTQTCSKCGFRKVGKDKQKWGDRIFDCPRCGHSQDRDHNAAFNLAGLGQQHLSKMKPGEVWETNADGDLVKPSASTPSKQSENAQTIGEPLEHEMPST